MIVAPTKQNRWARRASFIFGPHGLNGLLPLVLLSAHYIGGAQSSDLNSGPIFPLLLIVIGLIAFALGSFRAATPGLAFVAILFSVWVINGYSADWIDARSDIVSIVAAGALFIAGRSAGMKSRAMHSLWRVLIWSFLFYSILALIAHIANYVSDPMSAGAHDATKLRAGFDSSMSAATLLSIMALIALGDMLYTANHASSGVQNRHQLIDYIFRASMVAFFVFMLTVSCLWLTGSWFIIVISTMFILLLAFFEFQSYRGGRLRLRKRYKLTLATVLLALIGSSIGLFVSDLLSDRTVEIVSNLPSKLDIFGVYWAVWLEQPLFGHGFGSFQQINNGLITPENVATLGSFGEANNVFLQWLIEHGIVGTGLICSVLLALHIPIVRALRQKTARSKTFLSVFLCVSGLVLVNSMLDYSLEIPSIMWTYALLLGLAHGRSSVLLQKTATVDKTERLENNSDKSLAVA